MANESVVSFKRGQKASLDSVNKMPGQILFSLNADNTGSIYYDENGTTRYRMSWDLKDTTNKFTISSAAITTTSNRVYPVGIDKDGYLAVNIPWVNTTYNDATTGEHGLMSAADKQKLDGIASGAKTGTVTSVATGIGLTGGTITTSGTIKIKLVSETALTADSTAASQTNNRIYSIVPDKSGNLAVVVPWINTTYNDATSSAHGLMSAADKQKLDGITAGASTGTITNIATGVGLVGGPITSSGTIKVNLANETALSDAAITGTTRANRTYPIVLDKNGALAVVIPWDNTTYNDATTSVHGLMSIADKQKLDGIAAGAKTGTVTSVATGAGLLGGTITTSGTLKVDLKSETKLTNDSTAGTETANRVYPIALDKSGHLAVVVPWSNTTYNAATQSAAGLMSAADKQKLDGIANGAQTGTVTSIATGAGLTGGTITTSGTLKVKLASETALTVDSSAASQTANRIYSIVPDKSGNLSVVVPWSNTTYNAATQSAAGLMSAADKQKLDGIAAGAQTGTVTSVATGVGLVGGTITTSGTLKVNLLSETKLTNNATAATETANRVYPVALDQSGKLAVVVPWSNTTYNAATQSAAGLMSAADKQKLDGIVAGAQTGTVTSVATGAGLTGGTITTSGTLKANLKSEIKLTNDSTAGTESSNRVYPVALDKSGYLAVVVPWSNTAYSAGVGLTLSSTTFKAKLKTETAFTADSASQTNNANRQYMVGVDKSGYLSVNIPWTDTNTKVTQTGNNENKEFPILLKYTNNATDETNTVKFNKTANMQTTINPSTGTVSAKDFKVQSSVLIEYNSTTESLNFVFL